MRCCFTQNTNVLQTCQARSKMRALFHNWLKRLILSQMIGQYHLWAVKYIVIFRMVYHPRVKKSIIALVATFVQAKAMEIYIMVKGRLNLNKQSTFPLKYSPGDHVSRQNPFYIASFLKYFLQTHHDPLKYVVIYTFRPFCEEFCCAEYELNVNVANLVLNPHRCTL